ncbi:hypothetical protein BVRB_6g133130 [Beta vulgaris subsp. vulgaris]|nr:hypothetical protein BVRB_6g133130 [Beta vulgaris subsp. vulgaris]
MLPTTSLPQHLISANLPRRMLLLNSPNSHPNPAPPPADYVTYPSSRRGSSIDADVVMIFSVLLCLLIFSICVNCLIRCMLKCFVVITAQDQSNLQKKIISNGVDKRALRTFPVVKYSKEVKIQGLSTECVICLSEFKGGEKVRILPKCNHGFHVHCIDKWLSSQSSCPTCRQSLVDTCKKIIGCDVDNHHHHTSSSSSTTTSSSISSSITSFPSDTIAINILPLEREDFVRD